MRPLGFEPRLSLLKREGFCSIKLETHVYGWRGVATPNQPRTPGGTRTPDILCKREELYATELRTHVGDMCGDPLRRVVLTLAAT